MLERSAGRGRQSARKPIKARNTAKGLKVEGIGDVAQKASRAVFVHHCDYDLARIAGRAREQPTRNWSLVQGQTRGADSHMCPLPLPCP